MSILDDARDAIAAGPVCDACLGRQFADRSHGLANRERGRSLRVAVALEDDEPYEGAEDCWVCEGEATVDRVEAWAERAAAAVEGYDFATYQVGTRVPPLLEENDDLFREDAGLDAPDDASATGNEAFDGDGRGGADDGDGAGDGSSVEADSGDGDGTGRQHATSEAEALKTELNREVGKRFGRLTDTDVDFERPDVQLILDLATDEVDVQVNSAFVYGRYRKLERDIPQTRWPCNECGATGLKRGAECPGCDGTGYRYDRSVEQLSAPVVEEAMDGEEAVFHGAGREDVDALMLGTGRPFVIEVRNPRRRTVDVETLEADVNEFADGAAEVEGLRLATHDMVERVKEHDASKRYRMDVEFDADVDAESLQGALADLEGATIEQRTPQRVDHRRADTVRTRAVYEASGELVDARHADVQIHGAGGLYVKELVSSDEGRTEPSLAGLLDVGATVTALDVLAVEGKDEPFERDAYFLSAR